MQSWVVEQEFSAPSFLNNVDNIINVKFERIIAIYTYQGPFLADERRKGVKNNNNDKLNVIRIMIIYVVQTEIHEYKKIKV